jgi:CubicO group peptidase (beta-lactamase class C family)
MTGGFRDEGLARFADVAARHVDDGSVPGLVALLARGDQVHVEVRGSLSVGGPSVRRDSLFRIASTTKPVTGTAVMALIDEGLLHLDDPVERWLPELGSRRVLRKPDGPLDDTVPAQRSVTVRDLLTFTFGFGMDVAMFAASEPWPVWVAAGELHLGTFGPPNPAELPGPDQWIAALGTLPLLAQPGERWLYNTGAQVLGVLLARAAGMALPELLRTRIFEPLGMAGTGFWAEDTSRLATAYAPGEEGLVVWDPPEGQWSREPAFPDAAAGLVSTADDLLAFARMLLAGGDRVLHGESVAQMTSDQLSPDQRAGADAVLQDRGWGFCQSVVTQGPWAGAFGWDGGLGSSWLVDPRRDLVVIVLTQRMFESPALPLVHREMQAAALDAVT